MSGPGSLPIKLAGAAHAAASISHPHQSLRSHGGSLSTIRDSLVPATARQLFLVSEETQASLAFRPCVRPDCSPTLAAGSGIGCLQVGPRSSCRPQDSYLAGSLSASVRARFREAHRCLCNANDWVHGGVHRWWWAFGCKPASGAPQDVLQGAQTGEEAGLSMDEGVEGGSWGTCGFRGWSQLVERRLLHALVLLDSSFKQKAGNSQ